MIFDKGAKMIERMIFSTSDARTIDIHFQKEGKKKKKKILILTSHFIQIQLKMDH